MCIYIYIYVYVCLLIGLFIYYIVYTIYIYIYREREICMILLDYTLACEASLLMSDSNWFAGALAHRFTFEAAR